MGIRGPAGIQISNTGILLLAIAALMLFFYSFSGSNEVEEGGDAPGRVHSKFDRGYKISEVLSAAIFLTELAGTRVREIRESDKLDEQSKGQTAEGVNDPLTMGDLESHRLLVKGFMKAFPNLNLVSEEHEKESVEGVSPPPMTNPEVTRLINGGREDIIPAEDITVWVDPLDATKEYTERLTEYVTVMACVAVKGKPVAGIIRKPFDDVTYFAWVDHGISETLKSAQGASEAGEKLNVIVSRSHAGEVKEIAEAAFAPKPIEVTPAGGAGFKTIEVIKGLQDMYVHTTLIKKWDICAGDAILQAMGGKQTDLKGDLLNYSHKLDPKAEHGLIATMHDHETYRAAMAGALGKA